jgi:hypothetical protein
MKPHAYQIQVRDDLYLPSGRRHLTTYTIYGASSPRQAVNTLLKMIHAPRSAVVAVAREGGKLRRVRRTLARHSR